MLLSALPLALALCLTAQEPEKPAAPAAPNQASTPDPTWKPLGKDLWFDPAGRRLILSARVCLREGYLEHLLCLARTKEHESILATAASPRLIHAGLILIAGEPGHAVRYRPEFQAPAGPAIAIELEWSENGKIQKTDARNWVKDEKTGKALESHWVFAGSDLFQDPDTKKVLYAADGGDLITVANFPTAILDLPIASSNSDADRSFVAFSPRVPPLETPVTMILRAVDPAPEKPKP